MLTKTKTFINQITTTNTWQLIRYPVICVGLSWFYAICSQIIIPLPFNLVPLSIQPLPVTLCTMLIGWPAIVAYVFYLLQGILGAPFFAGMGYGISHFMGPTGGYLVGFLFSALFLNVVRGIRSTSRWLTLLKLECSNVITFACGLAYLSFFVPANKLVLIGLMPFLVGDFVIKALAQLFLIELTVLRSGKNLTNNPADRC